MNRSPNMTVGARPSCRLRTRDVILLLSFCLFSSGIHLLAVENPSSAHKHLEQAYRLLNENRTREAVVELEAAHRLDPGNSTIANQLGYAYQSLGNVAAALNLFSQTNLACRMKAELAANQWKILSRPYFYDVYVNPVYLSRFDDTVIYGQARLGAELGDRGQWQPYLSFRYTDDSESTGGHSPVLFSDNAAIFGAGMRFRPWIQVPVSFYGEAGRGYDLTEQNRPRWRDDFRAGASYFDRRSPVPNCTPGWRFPLKRSSSLYGDLGVYSRYDRNWIGYAQWREGLRLAEKERLTLDGFFYAGATFDSNDDFYNNIAEAGVGAALTPDIWWPFQLRYIVVKGAYLKTSPRPASYGANYTEHRWDATAYVRF